jgi:hypothetical protein
MLVDKIGDKIVHRSRTGDKQAVGKLVHRDKRRQRADPKTSFQFIPVVHRLYCYYY